MHHPTNRIAHTMAFVTPVVEHWLEREIAQWVHPMKDRSDNPSHHERTLLPRSYISLPITDGVSIFDQLCIGRVLMSYDICCTQKQAGLQKGQEGYILFNDSLNTFYLQLYGMWLITRKPTVTTLWATFYN